MEIKGTGKAQQRISHKMPNKAAVKVLDATSKPVISAPKSVQEMTSRDFQRDTHAHIDVTSQLLKDRSTIRNFQLAISLNKHLFRGKTVLDVGCGTGILSLFAAKAGAARVFSVDQSSVVDYTRKIVAANHYENIIEVIHGRIEDICLPVKQVDIILCDWMGYSLLYQSTCEAVIFAREKWLRKDTSAVIFPDVAKLLIAGFQDTQRKNEKIEWWKNVYGFNMKSLREFALKEPCFYAMPPDQIITTDFTVKTINLYTATINDIGVHSLYSLRMLRSGLIDGIVTYFQVGFSKSHIPFIFSTDPWSPHTHWMQSVFFFDQAMPAQVDEIICGGFEMWPADPKKPDLNNIEVSLELCCGEPMQVQVIMHWQLQPHVSNVTPSTPGPISSAPSPGANTVLEETKESTENMSPFLAAILRRNDNKNMVGRKHKRQIKAKQANLKKDIIYTY